MCTGVSQPNSIQPAVDIGLLMQDWATSAAQPMTVFSWAGDRVLIPLDGKDTAQKDTVMEATLPLGSSGKPQRRPLESKSREDTVIKSWTPCLPLGGSVMRLSTW